MHQWQPCAGTVVDELGDVQRALIQRAGFALRHLLPRLGGHELVEVLAILVVAHVDDHMTVAAVIGEGALVFEPTEGSALDRRRIRSAWINLHHPTEPVGLVRVGAEVEARAGAVGH
jgi:hypothetical protein